MMSPEQPVSSQPDWKTRLSPEAYHVTREKGTERPFTGEYYTHHEKGTYCCVCCGAPLFDSEHKYESGSGWPSFWQPVASEAVATHRDHSHGMIRTEVICPHCDAHLGHVFTDGPEPTGQRYCINSVALSFQPATE